MVISEEHKGEVERLLKIAHTYKDDASQANASHREILNKIAELLDKEQTKASKKHWKAVAPKIYGDWVARLKGDKSFETASTVVDVLVPEGDEQ
jgi:hypothetical protein